MEREIFKGHIEIKRGMFGGSVGIVQILCKSPVLKMRTLRACDIVNQRGESIKQLDHSREVETREFNIFKVGQSDLAAAAAVDQGAQGFIPLVQRSRQNVELSTDAQNKSVLRIFKNEKAFQKKTPDKELNLSACKAYPDEDTLSFKFTYSGEDHKVKFTNKDEFQTMYYLVSRCRTLTDQERMTRMIGKGYNNVEAVKDAFEKIVVKRLVPEQRTAVRQLNHKMMLEKLDMYNELISEKTVEDYLQSLKKEYVAATDLAFLNGALQDEKPEFVAYFVEEQGVQLIISAATSQRKSAKVYQVFIVALECLESIIDKPKTPEVEKFGMEYVFGSEPALDFVVQQLDHPNFEVRAKVILLLETMMTFCFEPPIGGLTAQNAQQMIQSCESGMQSIITALERHSQHKRKPHMWHLFIDQLKDALELKRNSTSKLAKIKMQFVADILGLVNIILGCYRDVEARILLRNNLEHGEFMVVMNQIMEEKHELEKRPNKKDEIAIEDFEYAFDEYEQRKNNDKRFTMYNEDVDLSNINDVYDFLYKQCIDDGSAEQLAHIFRHLLLIPKGQEFHPLWETCVRIIKKATERAQQLDGEESETDYDNLYGYLLEVLNKREKGTDPVSILHKKQAEIQSLQDTIQNLEYELEEVKKGGILAGSLSMMSLPGSASLSSDGGSAFFDRLPSMAQLGSIPPAQMKPLVPKPDDLESELKSLLRLAKHGAQDSKLKEVMAKKGEPKENWESNIKKVRDYLAAMKAYEDAGGADQLPQPMGAAPVAAIPEPKLPDDLKFLLRLMKMGANDGRLKQTMAQKGIPKDKWDESIATVQKYKADLAAFQAGPAAGPPPPAAVPPPPEIPQEFKKFMKLFKMGLPDPTIKNKMAMSGIKTSRFAEAKEWFEKKKAYDAKYPGGVPAGGAGMPGGAPAAKPPAPKVPEDLKKFMKLFKMGLPEQTVKNKMVMSGVKSKRFDEAKEWWEKVKAYKQKYPDDAGGAAAAGGAPAAPAPGNAPRPSGMIDAHKKKKEEKKKKPGANFEESKLWQEVVGSEVSLPDMDLFAPKKRGAPRAAPKVAAREEEVEAKKELESLIMDPAVKKQMSFFLPMLRRAGISFATLQQKVWNLNGLDGEIIGNLYNAVSGEASEWLYIKESTVALEDLDEASKMYVFLKNIPRVKQRLKHWQFVLNFENESKDLSSRLKIVQDAIDGVNESKGFRTMLSVIFECFKKNNPKKWEGKKGFPIRLLTSINKKKIVVNNEEVTWLMYIFQSLQKSNPDSLNCVKALEYMKKSLKYKDLSEIKKTVDNFRNSFKSLAVQLKNYKVQKADPGCTDGFKRFFGTFAEKAKPEVEAATMAYKKLEQDTKKLAKLLGESELDEEKKINTRYFQILADFYGHCNEVLTNLNNVEKKKEKKKRLQALQAMKAAQKMKKRRDQAGGLKIGVGGGAKKKPKLSPTISSKRGVMGSPDTATGTSVIAAMRNKRKDKQKKRQRMEKTASSTRPVKTGGLPKLRSRGLPKRDSKPPAKLPPPAPSGFKKIASPQTEKKVAEKRMSGLPRPGRPRPPPPNGGLPPPKLLSKSNTLPIK